LRNNFSNQFYAKVRLSSIYQQRTDLTFRVITHKHFESSTRAESDTIPSTVLEMALLEYVPSFWNVATFSLAIAVLYRTIAGVYLRYRADLCDIPGPELAAWTSLWRFRDAWKGQAHRTAVELHRKYGKLVRIGPQVISVSDPAMIPVIYNTNGNFTKSGFYPLQSITWHKRQQLNVFSTRDEAQHNAMKRKVASAYAPDALLKMENNIDDCGRLLKGHLKECADQRKSVDLGAWLLYYGMLESARSRSSDLFLTLN